ncbi:MAG: hypothetical protein ABSC48_09250 [Terracidiphilus sp.]
MAGISQKHPDEDEKKILAGRIDGGLLTDDMAGSIKGDVKKKHFT